MNKKINLYRKNILFSIKTIIRIFQEPNPIQKHGKAINGVQFYLLWGLVRDSNLYQLLYAIKQWNKWCFFVSNNNNTFHSNVSN